MTLLAAIGVSGGYEAGDVVRDVSMALEPGRCLAVLGPNGSGKSTLMRMLAGILPARSGEVRLLGTPLHQLKRRRIARTVAFVPQVVEFAFRLSVEETVQQGRAPHLGPWRPATPADHAAVARAIALVALTAKIATPVQHLSGGERQRVLLARALATEPRILLLDEPAAALDVRHQLELVDIVRRRLDDGVAAVVVLHDWNLALRMADDLLVLHDGAVHAYGPAADVISPELFSTVFGVEVDVERGGARPLVVPRRLARRSVEPTAER